MVNTTSEKWKSMVLPSDLAEILEQAKSVIIPKSKEELIELSLGNAGADSFDVKYDVPGRGVITEAQVVRCRNGLAVNYTDKYMRRRDPDSMIIADDNHPNKTATRSDPAL